MVNLPLDTEDLYKSIEIKMNNFSAFYCKIIANIAGSLKFAILPA